MKNEENNSGHLNPEVTDEEAMKEMEKALIKLGFGLGKDNLSWQAEQRKIAEQKNNEISH